MSAFAFHIVSEGFGSDIRFCFRICDLFGIVVIMGLTFPTRAAATDPDHGRVRFVGHDGMFQISFSITTEAISPKRLERS